MQPNNARAVAFIFARGGSKGVPRKNVKSLAGKPLIAYAIEVGRQTPGIETVIVSTDDAEIAEVARQYGAEVPFMRPPELAGDTAPEWLAWRHAIHWFQDNRGAFDLFVSLPTTSPFRGVQDARGCMDAVLDDPSADIAITITPAIRSPYFNMVKTDEQGYMKLVIDASQTVVRRQDAPKVYDMTTVAYAARPSFVLNANSLFAGKVRSVVVPQDRALDIDTPFDFMVAEAIAKHIQPGTFKES
jgi:CMP-N-acetylneuraminic acid synthetase